MAKWQMKDTTGINVGGEFYQADKEGIVTVPDNVGDLAQYGFVQYFDKKELKQIEDAQLAAEEEAAMVAQIAADEIAKVESQIDQPGPVILVDKNFTPEA